MFAESKASPRMGSGVCGQPQDTAPVVLFSSLPRSTGVWTVQSPSASTADSCGLNRELAFASRWRKSRGAGGGRYVQGCSVRARIARAGGGRNGDGPRVVHPLLRRPPWSLQLIPRLRRTVILVLRPFRMCAKRHPPRLPEFRPHSRGPEKSYADFSYDTTLCFRSQ